MSTPVARHGGLYALQLPPTLLDQLRPRSSVINSISRPSSPTPRPTPAEQELPPDQGGAYRCALTGAAFDSLEGLKDHYKTDWYRYNVKLKLQGHKTPVGEDEFKRRMQDLSDSLSGSDSSTAPSSGALSDLAEADEPDSDAEGSDSQLSRLMRKTPLSSGGANAGDDDELAGAAGGARSALMWFDTPVQKKQVAVDGGGEEEVEERPTQYGVYRSILPKVGGDKRASPNEGAEALADLRALQLASSAGAVGEEERPRCWTLLMFGGGHFAGMVVDLKPRLVGQGKGKEKAREVEVIERKTFHRYTTRRKQGGSQSANDNSGSGKAKSAGANIRRANEMALIEEVRELLSSWSDLIQASDLVFLRCSKTNYKTFFGDASGRGNEAENGSGAQAMRAAKESGKVRGYGFATRRPTIAELLRSFLELTRVKTTHLTAAELAAADAAYLASITPRSLPPPVPTVPASASSKPKPPAAPKLTKAEELERDRWARLLEMVRKGRLEALSSFLDKYGPELESGAQADEPWGTIPPFAFASAEERQRTPTLLHVASAADQPSIVRYLLRTKSASPLLHHSQLSPSSATDSAPSAQPPKTPYDLAPSRPTRNEFRFLAFSEPTRYDWLGEAHVPSGLDEIKEKEREAKEEQKRLKVREREEARLAAAAAEDASARAAQGAEEAQRRAEAPSKGPQRVGGVGGKVGGVIRGREREGLSEEQKRRVEREERARAAEERFRRMAGGA